MAGLASSLKVPPTRCPPGSPIWSERLKGRREGTEADAARHGPRSRGNAAAGAERVGNVRLWPSGCPAR